MTKCPEKKFKMQATASALLAIDGRTSNIDCLKLARVTLANAGLAPECRLAVSQFLFDVNADARAAGNQLMAFVRSMGPADIAPDQPRFDWQDRADIQ